MNYQSINAYFRAHRPSYLYWLWTHGHKEKALNLWHTNNPQHRNATYSDEPSKNARTSAAVTAPDATSAQATLQGVHATK